MGTLGEALNENSKAVVEAIKKGVSDAVETDEDLPELENGKAVPPKAKRKYTKRAAKWGAASGESKSERKEEEKADSISIKFAKPAARVRMNLTDAVGEEVLMGAARFPIFAADMAGTLVSKGRFALIEYVDQKRLEKVDAAFKEGVLGSLEIECTPLQAYLLTCAGVVGSALALAGLTYTFALKEKAGKAPKGFANAVAEAARNGSLGGPPGIGGNGASGYQAPEGMGAVQQ